MRRPSLPFYPATQERFITMIKVFMNGQSIELSAQDATHFASLLTRAVSDKSNGFSHSRVVKCGVYSVHSIKDGYTPKEEKSESASVQHCNY